MEIKIIKIIKLENIKQNHMWLTVNNSLIAKFGLYKISHANTPPRKTAGQIDEISI